MTPPNGKERRTSQPLSESEMYKLEDVNAFIEKERRRDELDKLREVQEQRRAWLLTVAFCALINLVLISLAISGLVG